MTRGAARRFITIALLLGVVAVIAHSPVSSDRDAYERIGRQFAVLDCHDVHCFRVLVAVVLEHLPGPSLFKWKAYAVLTSAAAALAVGRLSVVLGLSPRLAVLATWIAAAGFGPLQSVFDPYTSDPLMYLLGPLIMADLLENRIGRAGVLGAVGVLAKEFAAVPMWIFTLVAAWERRWDVARRALIGSLATTLVWLALQTWLMALYNYSYGGNPSVNLRGGGYFAVWVAAIGWPRAIFYLLTAFGPLYLLLAAGLVRAGRTLRLLAFFSLPAVAAFAYVQQPDRALWNFAFIVIPVAVVVLGALPDRLRWLFVAAFAGANLRLGEPQPVYLSWLRLVMLALSIGLALGAIRLTARRHQNGTSQEGLA